MHPQLNSTHLWKFCKDGVELFQHRLPATLVLVPTHAQTRTSARGLRPCPKKTASSPEVRHVEIEVPVQFLSQRIVHHELEQNLGGKEGGSPWGLGRARGHTHLPTLQSHMLRVRSE